VALKAILDAQNIFDSYGYVDAGFTQSHTFTHCKTDNNTRNRTRHLKTVIVKIKD